MIERYSRPEMAALWTLEAKYKAWLRVEMAVCKAWMEEGRIPPQDFAELEKHANRENVIQPERIEEIEATTRHDVIAFLTSLEESIGPLARYIHIGCTSSDIVDTANALLLREAGEKILADVDMVMGTLKDFALAHQGLVCMGRTHGIHAEPTTYALKFAGFYAEFARHKTRFAEAVVGIATGKLSGAVGTNAILPPHVEERALAFLGLQTDTLATQIIQRDRYAHYFTALALMAGGVERLCVELRHLQRTEVHEVEEGFGKGQKGSSAMPHKKNPISAENLSGLARVLRGNALASMEDQALWHERDISHSSVERVIMPDSTILMDYMLHRLHSLVKNLRVLPQNVEKNLWGSYGLFFSQRVLTALLEAGFERQKAYELVQSLAMVAWETGRLFPDLVRENKDIGQYLPEATLATLFDTACYKVHEEKLLARVWQVG